MRTKLIRVSNEFANWLDSDGVKFLDPFKSNKKIQLTRAKTSDGLMKLMKNSTFYFPDNAFIKGHRKKRISAEYKSGKFWI